jgi:hypothetical protein
MEAVEQVGLELVMLEQLSLAAQFLALHVMHLQTVEAVAQIATALQQLGDQVALVLL